MSKEIIITFLLFLPFESGTVNNGKCPPLTFDGLITCENQGRNNTKHNDCSKSEPIGTIAKYKCKPFYVLRDSDSDSTFRLNNGESEKSEGELKCGSDGRWTGLAKFKLAVCQEDCGRRLKNPKPLIIHGVTTNSSNWPWHVAMFRRTNSSGIAYICGGTIISRSTILTVAHCVTNHNGEKLDPNSTLVVLGAFSSNFTQNLGRSDTQIITVQKIHVSKNYDVRKEYQGDIAVLHLNKNIEYTDNVSPICLPNDFTVDTNAITPGSLGDVVGFGVDESGQIAPRLKHGHLEIKSHSECFITLERILSESQFCAGSPRRGHRVTVCNGDSGGGLFRPSLIDNKYHIHGIVSTGEPSRKKGPCQTDAVFTRVYSFIIFIREILNEIKDIAVLQLVCDTPFPYRQTGVEEERVGFLTIPQEWKNKVTTIELAYVDIDADLLLQSLENSRTVQSINFTSVKFKQLIPTSRPQLLPLLKTFSLDVLMEDFVLTDNERRFPITITKEFLKSYLFFEKDVEEVVGNSDIVRIPSLKTNIDLTIHIFKLIRIHHEEATVVLSQIPFSTQILANLPSDFQLRHLSLSRILTKCCDSLLQTSNHARNIETLVLDHVTGFKSQDLSQALQILTGIREFIFIPQKSSSTSKLEIFASDLSKSLKHLALTKTMLLLDESGNSSRFRSVRQVSAPQNFNVGVRDPELETFYCDSCVPKTSFSKWIKLLSSVFPKLRKFILKLDENVPITISTFEHFVNLEFVVVMNVRGSVHLFNKRKGTWYMKSLKYSYGFSHLEFVFNRQENFWSSEADYTVGTRLWSHEKVGFKTGDFKFNGGYETRRRISAIPQQIQNRLHTVEILNTAMSKKVFFDSFSSAKQLKVLRLINVSFTDYFIGDLNFPNLIEYRFDVQILPELNYFSAKRLNALANILYRTFFLFEEVQPGFNVKVNLLSSRVKKYHVSYSTCVLLHWDANEGTLISGIGHTSEWLRNVKENPVRKLSFRYWELDPTSLPSTISHLNLNFVIVKDIGLILRRLSTLVNLKLINVRLNDDGNFKEWDWIEIDFTDISKHSHTLEYLALERAHVRNYSPGMTFEKVEFLYLESCTFEKSFVKNFMITFPNVKKLVMVGGNDHPGIRIYLDAMILRALKSKTLEWILISNHVSGSSPNRPRQQINSILRRIGINEQDSKYLILEKSPNSQVWMSGSRNSSVAVAEADSVLELELLVMKGVSEFGSLGV